MKLLICISAVNTCCHYFYVCLYFLSKFLPWSYFINKNTAEKIKILQQS